MNERHRSAAGDDRPIFLAEPLALVSFSQGDASRAITRGRHAHERLRQQQLCAERRRPAA